MTLTPEQKFELTKSIFSEDDFDRMGWHDVHIHAIAFSPDTFELLLDIDYMFAWIDPEPPEKSYSFWMSSCTLVFENVHTFQANVEWGLGLEISSVVREESGRPKNADYIKREKEWLWTFDCQEGDISFYSVGYKQYTRTKPQKAKSQVFSWGERGGVSFDRVTFDRNEQRTNT